MKRHLFIEPRIMAILKEHEAGVVASDLFRNHGVGLLGKNGDACAEREAVLHRRLQFEMSDER